MTPIRVVLLVSLALLVAAPPSTADTIPDPSDPPHVRITEPWLRELYEVGLASSPTLRSLAERLEESDVVVYLQTDLLGAPGVAGRLTLLSVVARTRYLVVRLSPLRSPVQQLGMIGHELQHAVEVADRPDIVDHESMYREYAQFGHVAGSGASGVTFDTKAAVQVGGQIVDELREAPLVVASAPAF